MTELYTNIPPLRPCACGDRATEHTAPGGKGPCDACDCTAYAPDSESENRSPA